MSGSLDATTAGAALLAWAAVNEDGQLVEGWRDRVSTFVASLDAETLVSLAEERLSSLLVERARRVTLMAERKALPHPPDPEVSSSPLRPRRFDTPRREVPSLATARVQIEAIVTQTAREIRGRWTPDLLRQKIRLSDGREVTWGEATVQDHRERLGVFADLAVANIEGAARHERALHDLTQHGASCLNALSGLDAA